MCLIAFAYRVHPDHPLLLLANRDEFHARPAAPLAWWPDHPTVLAGRDLQGGGSWLGLSRGGRMAAVTNVRAAEVLPHPRSRGDLVASFLDGGDSAAEAAAQLAGEAAAYGGFNLLLFDGQALHYASNRPAFAQAAVEPGVHALSNAQLDTPWPKALRARQALGDWLARDLADEAVLLDAMTDTRLAPDERLPQTGVGLQMERRLSPPFIRGPHYGTRCTSLLKLAADGSAELFERRYDVRGRVSGETRERFVVES